jgi:hypothetical protein
MYVFYMFEPIPLAGVSMGEAEMATHARHVVLPLVARFCCIPLRCIHCSSSANAVKKWQPLHEVIYGTTVGAVMEGGALLMS